jgi:hypothetical protein
MMGVKLLPPRVAPVINVVTEHHRATSITDRLFVFEPWIRPKLVEGKGFGHLHRENTSVQRIKFSSTHPEYPVVNLRYSPDDRLAGGKSANAVEWVRRKAKIACDDIDVDGHRSAARGGGIVDRGTRRAVNVTEIGIPPFYGINNRIRIPVHEITTVIFESGRYISFCASPSENTDDTLTKLMGFFNAICGILVDG